jgi:hypothetical protein
MQKSFESLMKSPAFQKMLRDQINSSKGGAVPADIEKLLSDPELLKSPGSLPQEVPPTQTLKQAAASEAGTGDRQAVLVK